MTLRRATPDDALQIAEIWNRVIRETAITFTDRQKSLDDVERLIADNPVWVVEKGSKIAGFATFGPFRNGPGYVRVAEHSIYIAPDHQGQGNGAALMAVLESTARDAGIRHLIACIGSEAAHSVAFHEAIGFRKAGQLPDIGWKFDRSHDLILMQKRL